MAAGLEEPGWVNLPDQGLNIVSAFQLGANLNRQRQRMEEQLLMAHNKLEEQERWHNLSAALQSAEHNRKMDAMTQHAYYSDMNAGMAAQRLALNQEMFGYKQLIDQQTNVSTSNIAKSLSTMKSDPGTPGFESEFYQKMADPDNVRGLRTPAGLALAKMRAEEHNLITRKSLDSNNAGWKGFEQQVKDELGGGKSSDLGPLQNYDLWKPTYVNKFGKEVTADDVNYDPKTDKPTGKFTIKGPPNAQGQPQWLTKPQTVVERLHKRYQELIDQKANIPTQISDTDLGVSPQATGTSTGVTQTQYTASQIALARKALQPGSGASQEHIAAAKRILGIQ